MDLEREVWQGEGGCIKFACQMRCGVYYIYAVTGLSIIDAWHVVGLFSITLARTGIWAFDGDDIHSSFPLRLLLHGKLRVRYGTSTHNCLGICLDRKAQGFGDALAFT